MQIPKFQLGLGLSMEFTEPEREKLGIYAPGKEPEGGKKREFRHQERTCEWCLFVCVRGVCAALGNGNIPLELFCLESNSQTGHNS